MSTKKLDYKTLSTEELQVEHSRLCALAHDNQQSISEELTAEFDDKEAGENICRQIRNQLDDAGIDTGVAEVAEEAHNAPAKVKKAKTKQAASGDAAAEKESTMATKTKKAATKSKAKKSAKKVAKKSASKKNGAAKKPREGKTSKVIALMKRAKGVTREEVLKVTGWKAVSMQQLAKSSGVKLKVDESERPYRYMVA